MKTFIYFRHPQSQRILQHRRQSQPPFPIPRALYFDYQCLAKYTVSHEDQKLQPFLLYGHNPSWNVDHHRSHMDWTGGIEGHPQNGQWGCIDGRCAKDNLVEHVQAFRRVCTKLALNNLQPYGVRNICDIVEFELIHCLRVLAWWLDPGIHEILKINKLVMVWTEWDRRGIYCDPCHDNCYIL